MDQLAVDGVTLTFNPLGGTIAELVIDTDVGTIRPLHRAPWVTSGDALPDGLALVERQLAGDFLCAPFGVNTGGPIHGPTANGTWNEVENTVSDDGVRTARYRLEQPVSGATVEKTLTLCPGHPFVYQRHDFTGGSGHMPVAHHAMVHVPGGARLSFSPKAFGVTPATALETDPARGRSILAYPRRFDTLAALELVDGGAADARNYPFADRHEDMLVMSEKPGTAIAWSAALAQKDGFLFFAIKDAHTLPETMLWMSNGGRDYAPWSGRHTAVLGIEEAATSCHETGMFTSTGAPSRHGLATGLMLEPGTTRSVVYGFGAIPVPPGWSEITDIRVAAKTLTLGDTGDEEFTLPFLGSHFGLCG